MTLETFAPVPKTITVAGRHVEITPLRMYQLPRFAKGVQPVYPYLLSKQFAEALALNSEGLMDAVTVATGLPADWVSNLYPDDFATLAGTVFEVNADFFARRVLPATRAAAGQLTTAIAAILGAPASPGSPAVDTGSPTSST